MIYTRFDEVGLKRIFEGQEVIDVRVENFRGEHQRKFVFTFAEGQKLIINEGLIPGVMLEGKDL